jgi:hypothetical protein
VFTIEYASRVCPTRTFYEVDELCSGLLTITGPTALLSLLNPIGVIVSRDECAGHNPSTRLEPLELDK